MGPMSILKDRLNIVVVSTNHNRPIGQRVVPMMVVYVAFFMCLALLATSIFFAQDYLSRAYQEIQLYRLRAENRTLKQRLVVFERLVSEMEQEMALLIEREKRLRLAANLPEIDDEVRAVGVGGPAYSAEDDLFNYDLGSAHVSQQIDEKIHKLLRQAKLERESLAQVCSTLAHMQDCLDHTPSIKPTIGYISSNFGIRLDPFTGRYAPHYGVDFCTRVGTPVYAPADGRVEAITNDRGSYGLLLKIDHGYGMETIYAHLDRITVSRGQQVKRNQLIAYVGNSGRSTGPHLHYEVRKNNSPMNPRLYFLPEVVVN